MVFGLVLSLKQVLDEHTSDELRAMLDDPNRRLFASKARAAALELLEERASGIRPDVPPDTRLRNQIRTVAWLHCVLAIVWIGIVAAWATNVGWTIFSAIDFLPALGLWKLGSSLRQFSPIARELAIGFNLGLLFLIPFLLQFDFTAYATFPFEIPFFAVFSIYCLDRLTRGKRLFVN